MVNSPTSGYWLVARGLGCLQSHTTKCISQKQTIGICRHCYDDCHDFYDGDDDFDGDFGDNFDGVLLTTMIL